MRCLRSLFAVASLLLFSSSLIGQSPETAPRITAKVDDRVLVTLPGNIHPNARAEFDRGPVKSDLPMGDLFLVLRRSPELQKAFDDFVASQYDSSSPNFHHWLTPDEIGTRFGPSLADVQTISAWLTSHGFSIDEVSRDRMSIRFSGTAAQVRATFHTEIHNLLVRNEPHIANMSDPQIPAALAPVVVGVKALHNFLPRPLSRIGSPVRLNPESHKWERIAPASASGSTAASGDTAGGRARPQYGYTSGGNQFEDLSPFDWATIYNVLPLWNASTPIDGTGQKIAIAGTSNIALSDVATFRSTFGLPANTPQVIVTTSTDPGTCPSNLNNCDQVENTLDVEWSGAVAKGAKIILVTSKATTTSTDPLTLSVQYIINNSVAPIMSVSYGLCELGLGTAGNTQWADMWKTAAAAGMSVFVSTGDAGAATCDQGGDAQFGTPYAAEFGLSVNGLASTPDNTAVGGTDFNWGSTASPYWNPTNASNGSSAKGYIPETPWNSTCTNPLLLTPLQNLANQMGLTKPTDAESACNFIVNNLTAIDNFLGQDISFLVDTVGAGGGSSTCTTNDSNTVASCSGGYAQPDWQTGVTGIPTDGKRALPDVSFFASNGFNGTAYLICVTTTGSTCTLPPSSTSSFLEIGGTSAATPAMAGVMALINQKIGSAQGNAAPEMYKLASKQNYANCNSSSVTNSSSCYFNDISTGAGTIAMPCDNGFGGFNSPDCTVTHSGDGMGVLAGYDAGAAYDRATGLGSMNVANVVNAWASYVGTGSSTVTVSPSATTILTTDTLSVPVTVKGSSTIGNPTGTVTLTGGGYTSSAHTLTASGADSATYTFSIPAKTLSQGVNTLTATYSGDDNYAKQTGTAQVTVNGAASAVAVVPSPTNLNSAASLTVTATVTGSSGTPTGTVTLSGGGYNSGAKTLDSSGKFVFTVPAYTFTTAGAVTLTASYSGDATYKSASNTANINVTISTFTISATNVTVTAGAITGNVSQLSVSPVAEYLGSVTITAAVTSSPSGAVSTPTLTVGGSPVNIQSASPVAATVTVATTAATAVRTRAPGLAWYRAAGGTAFAALLLFFLPFGSRRGRRILSVLLVLVAATFSVVGCGGSHSKTTPSVTVSPSKTTFSSDTAITVAVSVSGGSKTATGTVTLSGGGFTSSAANLSNGAATINIPANSLSKGSVTLTANYSGDSNFNTATGSSTVTVKPPATTAGTYTVTVTGKGNDAVATTATTTFTLTVQ